MQPTLPRRLTLAQLLSLAAVGALPGFARAQAWPNKAVTMIAPYPAGGGVDALLPEHAEVALARLAVTGRPVLGLVHGVLRVAKELGTTSAVSAGLIDDFLAALPAGGCVGGSGHLFL